MLKLMFNANDGGFHNFEDDELESARKNGWVDGEPVRKAMLDAKRKPSEPIAKLAETVTMPAQPEVREVKRSPGRPRNVVPSILSDGEV